MLNFQSEILWAREWENLIVADVKLSKQNFDFYWHLLHKISIVNSVGYHPRTTTVGNRTSISLWLGVLSIDSRGLHDTKINNALAWVRECVRQTPHPSRPRDLNEVIRDTWKIYTNCHIKSVCNNLLCNPCNKCIVSWKYVSCVILS